MPFYFFIHQIQTRIHKLANRHFCKKCFFKFTADASGIIEKVGADVQNLSVGQRVFVTGRNSGSYAEYIVTEAIYVFPLHHRLTFAQGAALGVPYFTAYKALIMGAKVTYVFNLCRYRNP